MKIKFANGTEFTYSNAFETEEYHSGANRRTLSIECDKGVISIDELDTVISNETNTAQIQLVNEEENITNIYDGYTLKLKCGIEKQLVQTETSESPAIYADKLIFKLGKPTYIEHQLKKLGF